MEEAGLEQSAGQRTEVKLLAIDVEEGEPGRGPVARPEGQPQRRTGFHLTFENQRASSHH